MQQMDLLTKDLIHESLKGEVNRQVINSLNQLSQLQIQSNILINQALDCIDQSNQIVDITEQVKNLHTENVMKLIEGEEDMGYMKNILITIEGKPNWITDSMLRYLDSLMTTNVIEKKSEIYVFLQNDQDISEQQAITLFEYWKETQHFKKER